MTNAGWHPDPLGRHQLRYFDGEQWTPHVADGNDVTLDQLAASTPEDTRDASTSPPPRTQPARTRRRVQWFVLAGILVLAAAATLGAVAFASSSSTDTATVHGSLVVRNPSDGSQYVRDERGGCTGGADLRDVNPKTPVVVEGDHNNELSRTKLGPGRVVGDACVFRFTLSVEEGERSYIVSIGKRAVSQYTFAGLQQPDAVALVIGGF